MTRVNAPGAGGTRRSCESGSRRRDSCVISAPNIAVKDRIVGVQRGCAPRPPPRVRAPYGSVSGIERNLIGLDGLSYAHGRSPPRPRQRRCPKKPPPRSSARSAGSGRSVVPGRRGQRQRGCVVPVVGAAWVVEVRVRRTLPLVFALVAALAVSGAAGSVGSGQARWVITDLGTLGGPSSEAAAINERGLVVGKSTAPGPNGFRGHAFLWGKGKIRDLGTLGGKYSGAVAINGRGQVVGWSMSRSGVAHPFIWESGKMRDLGTMGEAVAINERGYVIGNSDSFEDAFVWHNGKIRTLGGQHSEAVAINERGEIVGSSGTAGSGPWWHAFLWENGKMIDLGTLRGRHSEAVAINGRGQVVGESDTDRVDEYGSRAHHAFLWENGKMTDLETLPGGNESNATAINNQGQIVG
jgi:probable HAF family extracellular repeat protein